MKLASLKIVSEGPIVQRSVPATIEDTAPPQIRAAAPELRPPGRVRRLDVDGVLARSVPKTAVEILPLSEE